MNRTQKILRRLTWPALCLTFIVALLALGCRSAADHRSPSRAVGIIGLPGATTNTNTVSIVSPSPSGLHQGTVTLTVKTNGRAIGHAIVWDGTNYVSEPATDFTTNSDFATVAGSLLSTTNLETTVGWGIPTNMIVVDVVNGNDSTAVVGTTNAAQTVSKALQLVQAAFPTNGIVQLTANQIFRYDLPTTNSCWITNGCSVTIYAAGTSNLITENTLFTASIPSSLIIVLTNASLKTYDGYWQIPAAVNAGANNMFQIQGAKSISSEGGTFIGVGDIMYNPTFGTGATSVGAWDTNQFPRGVWRNGSAILQWDGFLARGSVRAATNALFQYIGMTITCTNNTWTNVNGMAAISATRGTHIVKDCNIYVDPGVVAGGSPGDWDGILVATPPANLILVNTKIIMKGVTNVYGGYSTNINVSAGRQLFNRWVRDSDLGDNAWITSTSDLTKRYLNIRTRDGVVHQQQIWP